jgi:dipeptidase D
LPGTPTETGELHRALEAYTGLEPSRLWRHFAALNGIPRPSGQEMAARGYVQEVAASVGASWQVDERGNTVVSVSARGASADGPPLAIQTHLDMVCEKEASVTHDCGKDPIRPRRDGDRIFASGTTLGADNGIGVAMALTLLTDPDVRHGPLELVFTVAEETGLQGALAFDASLLRAKQLINLDSEDPTAITVGSAAAAVLEIGVSTVTEELGHAWQGYEIETLGLRGGHSGVQIHEHLGNAIKILTEALIGVREAGVGFRLASLEGGGNHSAIPRHAVAQLAMPTSEAGKLDQAVGSELQQVRAKWGSKEPELALRGREVATPDRVMAPRTGNALLELLRSLPHGVLAMSDRFPSTVETSANLAGVETRSDGVEILVSIRSLSAEGLQRAQAGVCDLAEGAGGAVVPVSGYPGWEPVRDSSLLRVATPIYTELYGRSPEIQVVHGGLECGVIVSKVPNMEAISLGPLIRRAHTPEEHVYASSVLSTWNFLVALLLQMGAAAGLGGQASE